MNASACGVVTLIQQPLGRTIAALANVAAPLPPQHKDATGVMPSTAAHANDPAPSSDRRFHSRQPIRSLAYVELDEGNGGIVLNVSEGGLSVHAVMSVVEDIVPHLRFQLAQSKDWIETSARIAWTNESRKVAGLQFVDLPESTRTRLREWLSLETSPATVVEATQEESAPSRQSHDLLPPTGSPAAAPATVVAPPPEAEERYKNAPPISVAAAGPSAIPTPPTAPASPAPIYMFGRTWTEVRDSGNQLPDGASRHAKISRQMWILAALFLFLAVVSTGAGWVAGRGAFGGFFSRIRGIRPSTNRQQENIMSPSVPAASVSQIEIVDANNERWVIPFVPVGSGIEGNPRGQAPVNAPTRRAVEPPASALGLHPSPSGENAVPEKTNPPVSPTPLGHPENVSPSPASTGRRIEVPPPLPVPSTEVPQAGVLQPGEIVRRVDPVYPESAQAQRIEGTVKLRVTIAADGAVSNVAVVSGPGPLVEAAKAAVRQWRYTPTLLDGKPVEAEEYVSIVFQLPPASR